MRHPYLRGDTRGALDVPFRMLLSVVLVTMATAILFPALQAYQETEMEHRVGLVLAEIEASALAVIRHPGSSRTVLVDVPSSGGIRLEGVIIGGDLHGPSSEVGTIGWKLSSGASGRHLVAASTGPVPMAGPDEGAVRVDAFPCLLVLKASACSQGCAYRSFVLVTVA